MRLLRDDYKQIYVWVDTCDETVTISPHFDYEADAFQWYELVGKHIQEENIKDQK